MQIHFARNCNKYNMFKMLHQIKKSSAKLFLVFKLKYICLLTLLIILVLLIKLRKCDEISHFIIYSTFYYNVSRLYAANSMILLVNAKKTLKTNEMSLQCYSQNQTSTMLSKAQIRVGAPPTVDCTWDFFLVNCTTVVNPEYFGLTRADANKAIEIEFELPERRQLFPVVMCYPPMVFETRWQQIIFAIEIYRHFGVDLQIQYINSAKKEIVDLLKVYEKKKWIALRMFAFFDFNSTMISSMGGHPMHELTSRNQPTAYTDCLMKFRESSEFAIVADVDDILFPRKNSYYSEFSHWAKLNPLAAAFFYFRSSAKIDVSKNIQRFSILDAIKSLKVSNETFYGKTIYRTGYSETAWIHTPGMPDEIYAVIPPEKGRIYHVQTNSDHVRGESLNTFKSHHIMPLSHIENIEKNFVSDFATFQPFNASSVYADAIFKCYHNHEQWVLSGRKNQRTEFSQCVNPLICKKPNFIPYFDCMVARRDFETKKLTDSIVLHLPKKDYYWWRSNSGCSIFLEGV